MSRIHEIVARLKAEGASEYTSEISDAAAASEELGDTSEEAAERTEQAWDRAATGIGVAMAAGGAAVEGLARSQQDTRAVAGRLANALEGETTDSVMGLASEIHNATTDFDELVGMMETGRAQGIESSKQLQEYAQFWDMVGDATGESAGMLAESSAALRAVGIDAGNEAEALGAFGYVSRETSSDVGDLLSFLERTGPELREMGLGVDDAAGMLGVLEHELGMSGRTARSEFRAAVNEADGDLSAMLDTLGVSEAQLESYTGKVAESSEVIGENAEAFADSRTRVQELSARLEATMANYSGLTAAAAALSPVMMGGGAAMLAVNQAAQFLRGSTLAAAAATGIKTAATATWSAVGTTATAVSYALGAGIRFMLGPIGLVITAVGLLVAGGIALYRNWDTVKEKLGAAWDWISSKATAVFGAITGTIRNAVNGVIGAINSMIGAFNNVSITLPTIPDWVPVVGGKGGQTISLPNIPTIPLISAGQSSTAQTVAGGFFNRGGRIPGRGPNADSVLAAVTPGEWVLRRDAADALGPELLGILNRLDGVNDPRAAAVRRAVAGPAETHEIGQGGGGGRGPQTWRNLVGMMGASGVPHRVTSTVRNWGGNSYHETGHAIDLAGPTPSSRPTPAMGRIFDFWAQHAGGLAELIYAGRSRNVKNGRWVSPYAVAQHRDHVHVAATSGGLEGAAYADPGDGSGIPRWARPVLNAIARGFGRAFGIEDAEWAGGAYVDRPWRGMARVGEHEAEFVTPETQLARVIDERLAAGGGQVVVEEGAVQIVVTAPTGDAAAAWLRENGDEVLAEVRRGISDRAART